MKRFSLIFTLALIGLTSVCSAVGAAAIDNESAALNLPPVTGKYAVGTVSLTKIDTCHWHYAEKYLKGEAQPKYVTQPREMALQIWYPAPKDTTKNQNANPYLLDDETIKFFRASSGVEMADDDFKQIILSIKTNAVSNLKIADDQKTFPVLLFSPGLGCIYSYYQLLIEDLVSHGFIIIGINHPNISGITTIPGADGTIDHYYKMLNEPKLPEYLERQLEGVHSIDELPDSIKNDPNFIAYQQLSEKYYNDHFSEVVGDLEYVINELPALNNNAKLPIYGKIDFDRVGCFGHSYGGAASVQVCMNKEKICGAIDFDGSMFGQEYQRTTSKPILLVKSNREGYHEDPSWSELTKNLKNGYLIAIADSEHLSFTDLRYLLNGYYADVEGKTKAALNQQLDQAYGKIDPLRMRNLTRDCILAFFASPQDATKTAAQLEKEKKRLQ